MDLPMFSLEEDLEVHINSLSSPEEFQAFNEVLLKATREVESRLETLEQDEEFARNLERQLGSEFQKKETEENERMLQDLLRRERTCDICLKEYANEELGSNCQRIVRVLSQCDHHICRQCASEEIIVKRKPQKQSDYTCPIKGCGVQLLENDIRAIFPLAEVDRYIDAALDEIGASLVRCPTGCGWAVTIETSLDSTNISSNHSETGIDGQPLSLEARNHRDRYRVRCRRCQDTDFCAQCGTTPYHLGFTCKDFDHFKSQRHCRFCGGQVPKNAPWVVELTGISKLHKKAMLAILKERHVNEHSAVDMESLRELIVRTQALADVCTSDECKGWASKVCNVVHACGHACLGLHGEDQHMPCLECATVSGSRRADEFCSICWVSPLRAAPCIMLDCGHVFHQPCLERKVASRWSGARITFAYLDCPLCNKPLASPALTDLLAPHLKLKSAVAARAEQRLSLEGQSGAPELGAGGRYEGRPREYAMHRFAYYQCARCSEPYFGGLRSCEVAQGEGEAGGFEASEMVCGGCSSMGKDTCAQHGSEAIEFKCKFCCAVASWFCWGSTHFCDDCHRKQGTAESMSKKPRNQLPQCTPATCPLRIAHPPNGEEFVLGCLVCRSSVSL